MTCQLNWLEHCTNITEARVHIAASLIFFRLSFCNCISFKYLGITHYVLQDILDILGKGDWPLIHWLKQQILLYGWKFPPNMCSHWLLRGHMTSNNEKVFSPKSLGRQHCKIYDNTYHLYCANKHNHMIKCARHYDSKCWPITTITVRLNEFPASFLYNNLAVKNCKKTFLKNI